MNIIYQKAATRQIKIKEYKDGERDKAINRGWLLTSKYPKKDFYIITEEEKHLKFERSYTEN